MNLFPELLETTDPYGGFLLQVSFWRPDPDAPDPDMPGLKQSTLIFVPVQPHELCLCGSGKAYGACCRPKKMWQPVCLNPGGEDYSLVHPQEAVFKVLDAATLKERLHDDIRLECVDDTPANGFWLFWDEPAVEAEYGIINFGDIELKSNKTLLVTAMSDLRMQCLLDLLQEIAADCLDKPDISQDPPPLLGKPPRKKRGRKKPRKR